MNETNESPTVLVVDDYDDTRFMMRTALERSGYRVIEALNGKEAIDLAKQERPDLILMDLCLPLVDGIAASRRIREDEDLRDIPIIAFSAYGTAEVRAEALESGCTFYIPKPIGFHQLQHLLGGFLRKNDEQKIEP